MGTLLSQGYNLKAKYVIHTVAPKYYLEQENREELLRAVIRLLWNWRIKTVAKLYFSQP